MKKLLLIGLIKKSGSRWSSNAIAFDVLRFVSSVENRLPLGGRKWI